MGSNDDYSLSIDPTGAIEGSRLYEELSKGCSEVEQTTKLFSSIVFIDYIAGVNRFFMSNHYGSQDKDGTRKQWSGFIEPNQSYPIHSTVVAGNEKTKRLIYSVFLRADNRRLNLVFTLSFLKERYDGIDKDNTKVLSRFPLPLSRKDIISRKLAKARDNEGWEYIEEDTDRDPYENVFGEKYYPERHNEYKCGGISIRYI